MSCLGPKASSWIGGSRLSASTDDERRRRAYCVPAIRFAAADGRPGSVGSAEYRSGAGALLLPWAAEVMGLVARV